MSAGQEQPQEQPHRPDVAPIAKSSPTQDLHNVQNQDNGLSAPEESTLVNSPISDGSTDSLPQTHPAHHVNTTSTNRSASAPAVTLAGNTISRPGISPANSSRNSVKLPPGMQERIDKVNARIGRGGGLTGGQGRVSAPAIPTVAGAAPNRRITPPGSLSRMSSGSSDSSAGSPKPGGLAARRGGLKLANMPNAPQPSTPFANFSRYVDPSGRLNFGGKAVLHASGVDFSNGNSFKINMSELVLEEELGRGNYGTVQKVFHKPTNVTMAMKEMRLELDQAKLNSIIMELDVLHRAMSPYIVEFYGAFFIESCVYYCMEYMDAGSLDNLYGIGVPQDVLARIAYSMVQGLKYLKDDRQIIHRDVKPTNVLVNRAGQIKLCDFGVSGQLEKSLAKTNIGCQSYMAPERIQGGGPHSGTTYTVQADVWSLGLSLLELCMARYPYPPDSYTNVFAQLNAIVSGPAPELPSDAPYSDSVRKFLSLCLRKDPLARPTYAQLLQHEFLKEEVERGPDPMREQRSGTSTPNTPTAPVTPVEADSDDFMVKWVAAAMEARTAATPVSSSSSDRE